ncbi:MAG: phosphatidylserine/phosphatidylglycerophosphate/cardiolipin synthase family protein [Pseudobdellovibrio sp.]
MHNTKPSKTLTSFLLFAALLPTASTTYAQVEIPERLQKNAAMLQNASASDKLKMKLQAIQYLSSLLSIDQTQVGQVLATKQIDPRSIQDLSQKDTTAEEMKALLMWAEMVEKKTLRPGISSLIAELKASGTALAKTLNTMPQPQLDYAVNSLAVSIEAVVKMRGLTNDSDKNKYKGLDENADPRSRYDEWSQLSNTMLSKVSAMQKGFDHILDLSGSPLFETESAEILVNGPASFAKRDLFMTEAKKSISILTWSIYDDLTGTEATDLLIKKKQENKDLKIRIIIDGQVAATPGHGDQIKRLEAANIEVIRWFSKDLTYVGQHRKMMIVDDTHMIAGGLNFGDVYSHKNPAVPGWRDTDVYIKGAGAAEGMKLFAAIWNEQLKEQNQLNYDKIKDKEIETNGNNSNGIKISIINSDPRQTKDGSTIMLTILKAIREAKNTVDIENAYIILFPALKAEIQTAIQRNVKVRVFTNSGQSVDEPVVSIPILRSASDFADMKAQVFTKNGTTLHSKLFVVDSKFSMIMSYNLHPRSERVEGEMAIAVVDDNFGEIMTKVISNDVKTLGTEIFKASDIKLPTSGVSLPTLRLFFDML